MRRETSKGSLYTAIAMLIFAGHVYGNFSTPYYTVSRGGMGSGISYNSQDNYYYDNPHQAGSGVRMDFAIPMESMTVSIWAGLEPGQPSSYIKVYFGDGQGQWGIQTYAGPGGMVHWTFNKSALPGREITWIRSASQNFVQDAYVNTRVSNLVPCDKDSDGDGMKNDDEIKTGTNPWNPESYFDLDLAPIAGSPSTYTASWPGNPGKYYTLQKADSSLGSFQTIASGIPGQSPFNSMTINFPDEDSSFYRVLQATDGILTRSAAGFIRHKFKPGVSELACKSMDALNNDQTIGALYPAATTILPSGTLIYLWDPIAQCYHSEHLASFPPPIKWTPGTNLIQPGDSFWLSVPSSAPQTTYTNYTIGRVPRETARTSPLVNGQNFKTFGYPVPRLITESGLSSVLSSGSIVYFYRNGAWVSETWATFPPPAHWTPGTNVFYPGMGVNLRSRSATEWIQTKPYAWP